MRRRYETFNVDIVVVLIYFPGVLFVAGDKHQDGILITRLLSRLCCSCDISAPRRSWRDGQGGGHPQGPAGENERAV